MTTPRAVRALTTAGLVLAGAALAAPAAHAQPPACAPGTKLQVTYGGTWYPATVRAGPDAQGRCPIRYDGYDASWDEAVPAERMRAVSPPPGRVHPTLTRVCVPNAKLENFSAGSWGTVVVVGGPTADGKCNVRDEHAPYGWERDVGLDRLRAPGTATPIVATLRASAELKHGEYACEHRGELRIIYGFVVLPGGRYTNLQGGNGGTYRVDVRDRTVAFRGGFWQGASGADAWGDGFWRVDPDGRRRYHCKPVS